MKCKGCDRVMSPVEAAGGPVCLECCKARAAAAQDHRCHCGARKRPDAAVTVGGYTVVVDGERRYRGGRSFIPCQRCLGVIRQLS